MEVKYVNSFEINEDDKKTILEVLDYLDPHETLTFTYVGGKFNCQFPDCTFIYADAFQEEFPTILFNTK